MAPAVIALAFVAFAGCVAAQRSTPKGDRSCIRWVRDNFPTSAVTVESFADSAFGYALTAKGVQDKELIHDEIDVDSFRCVGLGRDEVKACGDSVCEDEVREECAGVLPPSLLRLALRPEVRNAVIIEENAVLVGHGLAVGRDLVDVERPQVLDYVRVRIISQSEFELHCRLLRRPDLGSVHPEWLQ